MKAIAFYDEDCGLCTASKRVIEILDWLRLLRFEPLTGAVAIRTGIPESELASRMRMVLPSGRVISGFAAWKRIVIVLPFTALAMAGSIAWSRWFIPAWALLFSPLFAPLGERLYDWVAGNRYRLPGSTCRVPS